MFQRTRWWGRGGGRSFISIGLSYGKTTWFCCGGKVGQCETSDFHSIKWVHGNGIAAQWRIMCLWGCEHKTRDVSPSHWLTAFLVCFSCCNSVRKWHVPFSWWLIQHPLVTFITLFSFFFFFSRTHSSASGLSWGFKIVIFLIRSFLALCVWNSSRIDHMPCGVPWKSTFMFSDHWAFGGTPWIPIERFPWLSYQKQVNSSETF